MAAVGVLFSAFYILVMPLGIGAWNHLVNLVVLPGVACLFPGLMGLAGLFSYRYRLDDQVLEELTYWRWVIRTYPRKGYDRLEFVNDRLYQADGHGESRKVRIWRWTVHPDDWAVFAKVAPKPRRLDDLPTIPPAQSAPPPPPAPPSPARGLLTVRYNRPHVWWLLAGSALLWFCFLVLWARSAPGYSFDRWLAFAIYMAGLIQSAFSIKALRAKICFSYDPQRREVTTRGRWGSRTMWYPRDSSEGLEYSVHTGTIYKITAQGRRRKFVRMSHWLNGEDWAAVVDHLLASAPATDTGDSIPRTPSRVRVQVNPWRAVSVVVGGFGLAILFFAADPSEPGFAWELLYATIAGLALLTSMDVVNHLAFRPFLTFDPEKGRVVIRPGTNRHAVFPSKDFERVEYSIYDARAYEVRSNGERKRLPIPRWYMNRADWGAFADALIAHQEQSASEPLENEGLPK
ncbi:hypothetical protein [Glycomyces sp. MUSA5-2]|uniref:hypothetical protein n=1 Tax=Glycomyces sp. MUSA5-2 TaxID=2053002 RepID=UPI00300914C5